LGWKPVKRGLVEKPEDWRWSSYRHYAFHELGIVALESPWAAYKRKHLSADPNDLSRIFAKDE
jgi:putative transposase